MSKLKDKIGWSGMVFIVVVGATLVLLWYFIFGINLNKKGSFFNKGHNAVWINHEWVGEYKSNAEINDLINNFHNHQIDTVFVHSGPIEADGRIDPQTYAYAAGFIEKAKAIDPDIQFQAWLGQIRNKINLDDENVRHEVAKEAMLLTQIIGFDGVHFDIEPVWDEDLGFISLLKGTREILPKGKKISVAMAELIPQSFVWMMQNWHQFKNYNTQINYENVGKYADQVVVMAYETSIKKVWLYNWLLKEQTIWLTNLMKGKEVFIGIPSYDKETQSFDPSVENVENGVKGILSGLNDFRSDENNFAGIAIYPYWETDEKDWKVYDNLWLK